MNMNVSEEIINRFLNGCSSEKEKAAVRKYFLEHPRELEKYLTEESWNVFYTKERLTEADSEKMLHAIEALTYHRRARTVWLRRAAVAAVFLGACAGFFFLSRTPAKETEVAAVPEVTREEKVNNTGKVMAVLLPDSTTAELYPGSRLHYRTPFGENDREVFLEGQALFNVKNNAAKPFTVFAGGLGTTALGTVFSITAGHSGKVVVHLLSGKVVVKPRQADEAIKPVYLKPGEKLRYDETKQTVSVELLHPKPARPKPVAGEKAEAPAPAVLLQFENEPLTSLFKAIETQYRLEVRYKAGLLDNMYFTGAYNSEKESLADFLNTIGILNNVTIRINRNIVYITP